MYQQKNYNKQPSVSKICFYLHSVVIFDGNVVAVEWYFKCEYDRKLGEFDGVSLIEFNDFNRIVNLKEFQSKIPHYYPYN